MGEASKTSRRERQASMWVHEAGVSEMFGLEMDMSIWELTI